MKTGTTIRIEQVGNGWIVTPQDGHPDMPIAMNDIHVFQDLEGRYGLKEFIAKHFGVQATPPPPANICFYCEHHQAVRIFIGKPCCRFCNEPKEHLIDPPVTDNPETEL